MDCNPGYKASERITHYQQSQIEKETGYIKYNASVNVEHI